MIDAPESTDPLRKDDMSTQTQTGSITARTAIAKNEASGRAWSVYLQEVGRRDENDRPREYELLMPDEDGRYAEPILSKRTGILVSWPTNPHNSGVPAILHRLNDSEARKLFVSPVVARGYAADQDGRYHRVS